MTNNKRVESAEQEAAMLSRYARGWCKDCILLCAFQHGSWGQVDVDVDARWD
jgi:hypothetical protein